MRKGNDKNRKDLSKVENSVAYVLGNNMTDINVAYSDSTISLDDFKSIAISIVKTAKKTTAQIRIINNITNQSTKDAAIRFIYNSYLAGCGMGTHLF